jgi:hypothetical protein
MLKEEEVMKAMRKRRGRFVAYVSMATLLAVLLTIPGAIRPALGQSGAEPQSNGTPNFPRFNPPPFDFSDAFYTANGINVDRLNSAAGGRFGLFRKTGPPAVQPDQANWVVDDSNTDHDRANVRILATTGGYLDSTGSPTDFISIIAFLTDQSFFTGVANKRAIHLMDIVATFEAYAGVKQIQANGDFAPTPCGSLGDGTTPCFDVTSVATPALRQDWRFSTNRSPIDGSSPFGYFCDDLLGMWIITYFWYTGNGFGPHQTSQCGQMLKALGHKNGISLDGTPIIKTGDELNFLEGKQVKSNPVPGFSGQSPPSPGCMQEGNLDTGGADGGAVWLICPAIPDPRNGGIAPDAFLDQVRKANGMPLDPAFTKNFRCLQTQGRFCNERQQH